MQTPDEKPHILLGGAKHAGKSTLISRLTALCRCPVCGFITLKDECDDLYMYPAALPEEKHVKSNENLIARCEGEKPAVNPRVFETLGVQLIKEARPGSLLVMDELGFLEADLPGFTSAVLEALKGDIPVLAAVKERDIPFLNAVRNVPKARLCRVDETTREELFKLLSSGYPFR